MYRSVTKSFQSVWRSSCSVLLDKITIYLALTVNKSGFVPQKNLKHHGVSIMSPFQTAIHHSASQPHGIQKLMCLRSALCAHQTIATVASGVADEGLNSQIREIDGFLQSQFDEELLAA